MFWAVFCWETLASAIHEDVTLTRTTYPSIAADPVHPGLESIPVGIGRKAGYTLGRPPDLHRGRQLFKFRLFKKLYACLGLWEKSGVPGTRTQPPSNMWI